MRLCFAATLLLLAAQTQHFAPINEPAPANPAGAEFIYHSHVEQTADGKLRIVNSITNSHPDSPLAVRWDEGGILCVAPKHLPPGHTASGNDRGIAEAPFLYNHSVIKYGNSLQYEVKGARLYADAQDRDRAEAQTRTFEFELRDANGVRTEAIEIVSTLDERQGIGLLSIRVVGGLSLILPRRVGRELGAAAGARGEGGWSVSTPDALPKLEFSSGGDRETLESWLGRTGGQGTNYAVLQNNAVGSNSIRLPFVGRRWQTERVYLIAFRPGSPGYYGLAANIHLPV